MPETHTFTVQQARVRPDLGAFVGPTPAAAPEPTRSRTVGRTLVCTGPSPASKAPEVEGGATASSLTWGRYGDGSRWVELHRGGRFLGLYR